MRKIRTSNRILDTLAAGLADPEDEFDNPPPLYFFNDSLSIPLSLNPTPQNDDRVGIEGRVSPGWQVPFLPMLMNPEMHSEDNPEYIPSDVTDSMPLAEIDEMGYISEEEKGTETLSY